MFYCLLLQYKLKEDELYEEEKWVMMGRKLTTHINVRHDKRGLNGINNPAQRTVDIYDKEKTLLSFKLC